jgi:hypothetical protein
VNFLAFEASRASFTTLIVFFSANDIPPVVLREPVRSSPTFEVFIPCGFTLIFPLLYKALHGLYALFIWNAHVVFICQIVVDTPQSIPKVILKYNPIFTLMSLKEDAYRIMRMPNLFILAGITIMLISILIIFMPTVMVFLLVLVLISLLLSLFLHQDKKEH